MAAWPGFWKGSSPAGRLPRALHCLTLGRRPSITEFAFFASLLLVRRTSTGLQTPAWPPTAASTEYMATSGRALARSANSGPCWARACYFYSSFIKSTTSGIANSSLHEG